MVEKLHKLAALRLLGEGMAGFDLLHQQRIEAGENPAEVDRDAAQQALTSVVGFFLDHGIELGPLHRLLGGLEALSSGSRAPDMFRPTKTHHRRADAPNIETIKGRLAAIMEFLQRQGRERKGATQWIARNIPSELKVRLGSVSARAVDSWHAKWGGKYGTKGSGQEGYRLTLDILTGKTPPPTEKDLKTVMSKLSKSVV